MQNFIFVKYFLFCFIPFRFPFSFFLPFRPFFPSRPFSFFSPSFGVTPHSFFPAASFFLPPFSGLFPSRQFFLFLSFRHPAPFFSLFLQSVSAPLLPDAFFSPGAFPPEHNISEHKPKHTDSSFCRPKCRVRQIIKNLPVTTYV